MAWASVYESIEAVGYSVQIDNAVKEIRMIVLFPSRIVRVGGCERLHKVVKCYVRLLYVGIGLTITLRTNGVVLSLSNLL